MVEQICIEGAQSLCAGDKIFLSCSDGLVLLSTLIPPRRSCPCSLLPGAVDAIVRISVDRSVGLSSSFYLICDHVSVAGRLPFPCDTSIDLSWIGH